MWLFVLCAPPKVISCVVKHLIMYYLVKIILP